MLEEIDTSEETALTSAIGVMVLKLALAVLSLVMGIVLLCGAITRNTCPICRVQSQSVRGQNAVQQVLSRLVNVHCGTNQGRRGRFAPQTRRAKPRGMTRRVMANKNTTQPGESAFMNGYEDADMFMMEGPDLAPANDEPGESAFMNGYEDADMFMMEGPDLAPANDVVDFPEELFQSPEPEYSSEYQSQYE
ncbi:unnamed protein product [Allacma fusca]|uniref:Uncharacterized protein n=1 Tax=Allacma fusca TaxID=39272 RepID=A0A8J2Q0X4_9HEXA|nr:unnamed protein product [Allacma fusca]